MAPFSKTTSHSGDDKKCCRLLVAAVLPDHAIYLKLQDPRRL
jgi:hypothetical protein